MATISRSFIERKDAAQWARQIEIAADRHDFPATVNRTALAVTFGVLIARYRNTVIVHREQNARGQLAFIHSADLDLQYRILVIGWSIPSNYRHFRCISVHHG
jgi:hypothetical protein